MAEPPASPPPPPPGESRPIVGLVPAAGLARRLGGLPFSKELLPVDLADWALDLPAPPPVADRLLGLLRRAGIGRAVVVLRAGKWDVPAHYGSGSRAGVELVYRVLEESGSVVESIAAALPFVADQRVALGFPDVLLEPRDALARLVERQEAGGADVVLGLFPTARPEKSDMVETDGAGRVRRILVKPEESGLELTWMLAVWTPAFSRFLLARWRGLAAEREGEIHPGHVVQAAIEAGMRVESVAFPDGSSLDVGTRGDLERALSAGRPAGGGGSR